MKYTENKRPINRCQYWVLVEPGVCKYWDTTATLCTFQEETIVDNVSVIKRATLYPYCNYIGTSKLSCAQYTSEEEVGPRCILPDPYRHLVTYPNNTAKNNNTKWVVPEVSVSGTLLPLNYTKISGYNNGKCNYIENNPDKGGTDVTCSGFTPHHLKFGALIPSKVENVLPSSTQLPLNYVILNKRSELGRCGRWSSDNYLFTLSPNTSDLGQAIVSPPPFSCSDTSGLTSTFADFYDDIENSYIRPPCNGAMPDCPRYTGNLASTGYLPYISSVFLRNGDRVMAEQILELRYNLQKENWDPVVYEEIFGEDATIYANSGLTPKVIYDDNFSVLDYELVSVSVRISDFDCFMIDREQVLLTLGTPTENYKTNFDTLIKDIKDLPLIDPLIRSVFDTVYDDDQYLSYKQKRQYIFETTKTDHKKILLVGDYFYSDSIFAINISDPDISFPFNDLFNYDNMSSYKSKVNEETFSKTNSLLSEYILALIDVAPEKVFFNESSEADRCFIIGVDTFFGENKIIVFDISNYGDYYTFDTIVITKHFCGGIIAQIGFSAISNDTLVYENENYEAFTCFPRFNPELSYEFKPLNSSTGVYTLPYSTYLDTIVHVPPANPLVDSPPTVFLGYKLYRIKVMSRFFVSSCDTVPNGSRLLFLGNLGKVLVIIKDDSKLHAVIRKWDFGETDANGNPLPMRLFLNGMDANGEECSIEMTILEYCTDRMSINQLLLKPKNQNEYVRLYSPVIEFKNGIYVYEKYSFNMTPSGEYEEVKENYSEDTIIIRDATTLEGDLSSGKYILKNPPTFPVVASIMFKSSNSGRVLGQIKSDLMIWVKQPFCSDVEIMYNWSANYQEFVLLPEHYCFVSDIGYRYVGTSKGGYSPMCGDHSFGRISQGPSPMWYPYKQCDSYASYNIYAGSGEYDPAPMEFWLDSLGKPAIGKTPYGSHNLRMLGPAEHYGWTSDVHSKMWACGCDYTHNNKDMVGKPWFSGWARIRNGVEGEAYYYLVQNGGTPPKFGNKHRGYLLSYRSTAALYYYKVDNSGGFVREKKWLPMYEAFSDIALDDSYKEYFWKYYFNTDDNVGTYINQLGILLASSTINGVAVNEHLVYESTGDFYLKRYRFSEIFKTHYTTTGMLYPEPRVQHTIGDENKPITAWLTYRDYSDLSTASKKFPASRDIVGGGGESGGGGASGDWDLDYPSGDLSGDSGALSIQWAWREAWKPLKRETPVIREALRQKNLATHSSIDFHTSYLSFIDIDYTNYVYSFYLKEYKRIPDEGVHVFNWLPSTYDKENPLPTYFTLRLGEGPIRLFNSKCELVNDSSTVPADIKFEGLDREELIKSINFYKFCQDDGWLCDRTSSYDLENSNSTLNSTFQDGGFILYDSSTTLVETLEEAKTNARSADRVIEVIQDGEIEELFFNTGLMVNIKPALLRYLPKEDVLIQSDYEFKLSTPTHDKSEFSSIDPSYYYPIAGVSGFNLLYNSKLGTNSTLLFHFVYPTIISKIEIVFKVGIETDNVDTKLKNYFNKPDVKIKYSEDDATYNDAASSKYEFVNTEGTELVTNTYRFNVNDLDYMSKLYNYISIDIQFSPTLDNFKDSAFTDSSYFTYFVHIQSIKVYMVKYLPLSENSNVYERKFNISVGGCGTYPVHGYESSGSLLYPDLGSLSTVYQYDNAYGMYGMPDSAGPFTSVGKVRDRLAAEIRPDGELIEGTYTDFEAKQKELYDDVALKGEDLINLTSAFAHVYKNLLQNTKVNVLPTWNCQLKNKTMVPLAPVPTEKSYYPPGHHWTWDRGSFQDFFSCGGGGLRSWRTIFSYKYGRVSQIYGYTYETDVFDLYSYGLSKTLTRWANSWAL